MGKTMTLAALCGTLLCADAAQALKTSRSYTVSIEGVRVGSWRLRNRVVDSGDACTYTVQWSGLRGAAPLAWTRQCTLDELKASDAFDCEQARTRFVETLVQRNLCCSPCQGFDEFGQQATFPDFIAGESSDGVVVGVISSVVVGDLQSFEVL